MPRRERVARSAEPLERLFLPDTPERVRELYRGFESEAATRDFGLLEEDMVVLDTETTGLSFRTSELIEIAAARISGREVVERFSTFVRPHRPIPPEIVRLTGIREADVADAPRARAAVAELADFVGGMPVLAHNAAFDRHFVESVSGAPSVSHAWVDTLQLSRIALPCLSSHRLVDLAEAFGCAGATHRADDDVEALAGLWRVILCGLAALPPGVLCAMADMHPEVDWAPRPVLAHLALEAGPAVLDLPHVRSELLSGDAAPARVDAAELGHAPVVPEAAELVEEFDEGGVVPRMYEGFERRDEQVEMSLAVREAFASSSHLAVEAGTGVGKSMAYLLSAVRLAQGNGITVGVATKTNALTDQLVSHELPALDAALPAGVRFFALKGYEHYPCLRRLVRAISADLPLDEVADQRRSASAASADMLYAIAVTLALASQSPTGDLDGLGIRWRSVPRSLLAGSSEQCERVRCPFFSQGCVVHGARRRAASADVVVTNHSLLLRNVEADGKILPPVRHWVVDEAHSFESEARRQWAREMSAQAARTAFERLGGTRTGAIHALMAQASSSEGSTFVVGLLTKAAAALSRASIACADLFDAVRGLSALAGGNVGYENVTVWIGPEVRDTPEWALVAEVGLVAVDRLSEACKALDEASAAVADAIPKPDADLAEATRALRELLVAARLVVEGTDESYVYSASLSRSRRGAGSEELRAEKIDIGSELAERWLPEMMSVVFTSATMAVGEDFSHFEHAVGLDLVAPGRRRALRLDSSYDFDGHMGVIVAGDLPQPGDAGYLEALEDLLLDVHVAMEGSVLTLFTNRREMESVYEGLAPRLAEHGLDLAMQERGGAGRQLRDRFLSERSLSLLALRSFWEGFDAGGETLRCVVIPKLPFASPRDPLVRERDRRERSAWWRYSLPEAVLAVKQAAGRLIRTSQDRGVLVLCDSRLVTKRYGRSFLASLPSSSRRVVPAREVGDGIASWRRLHDA